MIDDVFVTFNVITACVSLLIGFMLGLVLKDTAEVMLEAFLQNGRITLLLRIMPLFLLVFGSVIVVTYYVAVIAADIITQSDNNVYRATGRGIGNLLFVWACALGTWVRVRKLK